MDSAQTRPTVARRPLVVLMLALSVMIVASLANAASAFAWPIKNCITLTPATADNQLPQDATHTVTATVTTTTSIPEGQVVSPDVYCKDPEVTLTPKPGALVYFDVMTGPNAGIKGTGTTDANGKATFSWASSNSGQDVVEAYTAAENLQDGTPSYVDGQVDTGDVVWATAVKNWLPPLTPNTPNPNVTPQGAPAATLVVSKKCQSKKFKISSAHSNGTVTKYVLQVDGKTVSTSGGTAGTKTFTINSGSYPAGSHSIKLTTYFSDGTTVVKTGKFKRCAVRTTSRRISPNFTG